jgi:hypothetical protein
MDQSRTSGQVTHSGRHLLSLAAREADTIAPGVAATATESEVAEKIEWIC